MDVKRKIIVAIDGYSSCGKSTVAKAIAKMLGYIYIDTGAMYRAVTYYALKNSYISDDSVNEIALASDIKKLKIEFVKNIQLGTNDIYLNGENIEQDIRGMEVANNVSLVSTLKFVREQLVMMQRQMGVDKAIVLDGRDIGTIVYPNAELKLFMTANPDIRAQRRYDELIAKGQSVSIEEIKQNIEQRDLIDTTRKESPLTKADDAIVLDNSYMTHEQQLHWVVDRLVEMGVC